MLNPCKSSLAAVGFSLFICLFFFFVYPGFLGAVLAPTWTPTMSDFNLSQWPLHVQCQEESCLGKSCPETL